MLGRRSLNPGLETINLEIERTLRQNQRTQIQNQNLSDNQVNNQTTEMGEEVERRTMRDYSVPYQLTHHPV